MKQTNSLSDQFGKVFDQQWPCVDDSDSYINIVLAININDGDCETKF